MKKHTVVVLYVHVCMCILLKITLYTLYVNQQAVSCLCVCVCVCMQHLSLEKGKLGDIILLCTGPSGPGNVVSRGGGTDSNNHPGGGGAGGVAVGGASHQKEYHFSMFTNSKETFELMGQLTKMAIKE